MAGNEINGINALGRDSLYNDPMFLAAYSAYNPNFMKAQQANQVQTTSIPQQASTLQQAGLAETTTLPKVDYTTQETDSNTGLIATMGAVGLGATALIYAAKKGNGEGIIQGFKNIFNGAKNSMTKTAEEVSHKKGKLQDIKVVMKNGKPVYYIPAKTVDANTPEKIAKLLQDNTQLERQLKSLRLATGETKINAGTFTLKDGGKDNTVIFEGDKILDILNFEGKSIKDKFIENGKFKSNLEDINDSNFASKIEDYISKIKEGNAEIIRSKDTNLRDFTYTTQVGDSVAEVYRKTLSAKLEGKDAETFKNTLSEELRSKNIQIKKLTTLKEFGANDDAVLAYVKDSRDAGKNIDSIVSKDFLPKHKLPEGYRVHEFTLKDNKNTIRVIDGKVAGVTIEGKYYSAKTDKCKAYLERNKHSEEIDKAIAKKLKDNNIPEGATIVPV